LESPPAGGDWAIAEFHDGKPALVESRLGDGIVLLAAFPANIKWTNLPVKPEFVPLILRMVAHVDHRADVDIPSVMAADAPAEILVSQTWSPVRAEITFKNEKTSSIQFERSGSRLAAAYENTSKIGYYKVEMTGGSERDPRRATTSFAVNLAAEESRFETIREDEIRRRLPATNILMIDASDQASGLFNPKWEIWKPLIYFICLVIGIEFLLATLGGQQANDIEPKTVAQRVREWSPGFWAGKMTGAEADEPKSESLH